MSDVWIDIMAEDTEIEKLLKEVEEKEEEKEETKEVELEKEEE